VVPVQDVGRVAEGIQILNADVEGPVPVTEGRDRGIDVLGARLLAGRGYGAVAALAFSAPSTSGIGTPATS
jgi:hypothetical protein